ncbi:sigma-54-dependent Fis family transcriptional regulator [Tepidiphilus olei]|uniref:sigma-54-dependent Fis family transcriptional regulator n=1 Tax=Tepidiphilus olei TaxID=2502184 RepID=UPI0021B152D8|nr:sigma-54-dependent Fis family transcriptional regulator [Tepidiphilus olei]
MTAWERFLAGEREPVFSLRDLVARSWERCRRFAVDPRQVAAPPPIAESYLEEIKAGQRELLQASAPVMACARDFLRETGTVMLLADPSCTILTMEGDASTLDAAQIVHLQPGVGWGEEKCGTNAIGTALTLAQPVQIHSAEHFCAGFKRWSCAATAIRHPHDGEILGVLDVSGLSHSFSRQSLALVVTAAQRIESRITMQEMELRYRLLEVARSRSHSDGLLVVDRRGYPIWASANARAAIEALGGVIDFSRPSRLVGPMNSARDTPTVPPWLRPEWMEAIVDQGERLGAVVHLPLPRVGRAARGTSERQYLPNESVPHAFAGIVTADPAMQALIHKTDRLARAKVPILLLGETGVGKEEFAQGIHRAGPHAVGPYVALNCGGLSRELLASELFGYAEGAFTGARRGGMVGKIEAAHGGTLFLDEIGEMPLDLQPHLLRVLERGEIYRLGENTPRKVDFRLIAATHRDLRREVEEGRFRMDLFYRIAVTTVMIPPLRERKGDVAVLAAHFVAHFAGRHGLPAKPLSEEALTCLQQYAWPGNVRELRNVIESALLMSEGEWIERDDLPPEIWQGSVPTDEKLATAEGDRPLEGTITLIGAEKIAIMRAIATHGGNLTRAAADLKIAKSTLYEKVKRYGLGHAVVRTRGKN